MTEKSTPKEKGFLAVEVMVIALWLIALAAVGGMYAIGGKMMVAAKNMTTAGFLAEKQMACLKSGQTVWGDQEMVGNVILLKENGTDFRMETMAKKVPEESRLRQIVIRVEWQEYIMPRVFILESMVIADGKS